MSENIAPETTPVAPVSQQQTWITQRWHWLCSWLAQPVQWWRRERPGKPMVGWYDPRQLRKTATEVFISTIIGRHADRRLVEALTSTRAEYFDFSALTPIDLPSEQKQAAENPREYQVVRNVCAVKPDAAMSPPQELWLDYVSDVGDGWNSTYAIAQLVAQPFIDVQLPESGEVRMNRSQVLVFGGDEVYPTAERPEYRQRLESPYRQSTPDKPAEPPYAFAIPGNHDWYDSLASFSNVFCDEFTKSFAGERWKTPQNRSYFALQLPHRWWLLGIDVQLETDLDDLQLRYFNFIVENKMKAGDLIILCCSEPFWVYNQMYHKVAEKYQESNLYHFEHNILAEMNVVLYLAGDLHHYFRIWDRDQNKLRITSGGGGAFLHPTHGIVESAFRESENRGTHKRYDVKAYPSKQTSWWLAWRNLAFPLWNPWFGLITGGLYLLYAWFLLAGIERGHSHSLSEALDKAGNAVLFSPFLTFLIVAIWWGFLLFTEPNSRFFRYIAGTLHAICHLTAAFLTGVLGDYIYHHNGESIWAGILAVLTIIVTGWVGGSFIMGIYLFISLNIFGRHTTEAFSSLKIQDWKNFLRFSVNAQTGELKIFPIGVRKVPRKWQRSGDAEHFVADDPNATAPQLIEFPIVITPDPNYQNGVEIKFLDAQISRRAAGI